METLATPENPKTLTMPEASTEPEVPSPPSGSLGGDQTPFVPGDFVWGKSKGHSWWPARVCEKSEPSDQPTKAQKSTPVSYFGEETVSWCSPSQLKPFVQCFHQYAGSSKSKSFVSALESALAEIGKSLEVQLVCFCVPEEERKELEKYFLMNPGIGNYTSEEFLNLARNAAVDMSSVDLLEITRLRSWAVAYQRGCLHADSTMCHQRKRLDELVDKIDLDVPQEEVETPVLPKETPRCKKKRNVAVSVEEIDTVKSEECIAKDNDTGPGRRERKKSKYLSPPYTHLSGGVKLLAVSEGSASKKQKNSRGLVNKSEELSVKEDEKDGSLLEIDSVSTTELLAEFREAATNALHLKGNPICETVTEFFAKYRSSVFSSGADFVSYQKRVTDVGNVEVASKEVVNADTLAKEVETVENVNTAVGSKVVKKRKKGKANGENKSPNESEQSVKKEKAVRKRKMAKVTNSESLANLKVKPVTLSEVKGDSENNLLKTVETEKKELNLDNGKDLSEIKSLEVGCGDSNNGTVNTNSVPRKRKRKIKDEARNKSSITNGSKPEQNSAVIHLSFSQGVTLPSKENLLSEFAKYGPLLESEVEVLSESSSARVVFQKSTDAESAFNDEAGPFLPPDVNKRLEHLAPVSTRSPATPRPPLPYIRKNLERMISRMHGASPVENGAGASEGSNPDLVGAMQGLLTKVNQLLGGPAAGTST